jgi:DNA uptake protein ComE-like DNA-binding protein/endonuclease YncB( thermonuclease family)
VIFLTRVDAGLEMQRRRSPAKPDGLGGDEGILARAGIGLKSKVALWDDAAMHKPWSIVVFLLAICFQLHAGDWEMLKDCRLIDNKSNDGDSFHVRANGEEFIFRLYHVDAPESETDSAVADRISEQAAHFGITEEQTLRGGEMAKIFTKKALSQPFVVATRFQKAMGRSKLQRYYAVVLVGGDTDLAEMLVRAGLARAHGQVVDAPKGKRMAGYVDLEKTAKVNRVGLYGGNSPTVAEAEPEAASSKGYVTDMGAGAIMDDIFAPVVTGGVISSPSTQANQIVKEWTQDAIAPRPAGDESRGGKLNVNTASKQELVELPGVGEVIAERIIQSRPYSSLDDLSEVEGLGPKKISRIAPLVAF